MKKTKRFLALLLAILMILSGVLSGIPGGGIARAEEWDVGSEIVGDWTVSDWMEEEPAPEKEEEPAQENEEETGNVFASEEGTAGVQEVIQEEGVGKENPNRGPVQVGSSSAVVEEEAEEGEQETLTDGVFGEYDPSSVAETSFDEPEDSTPANRGIGDLTFAEEEEEAEVVRNDRNAGDPNYIYYTNWNTAEAWKGGWEGHDGVIYAWVWKKTGDGSNDHENDQWVELKAIGTYTKGGKTATLFRGEANTSALNKIIVKETMNWSDDVGRETATQDLTIGTLYSLDYYDSADRLVPHPQNPTDEDAWNPATDITYPSASNTVYFTNYCDDERKVWGGSWKGNNGKLYARVWNDGVYRWVELNEIGNYKDGGLVFSGDVGDAVGMKIYTAQDTNAANKVGVDALVNDGSLYSPEWDEDYFEKRNSDNIGAIKLIEKTSDQWNQATHIIMPTTYTVYFSFDNIVDQGSHFGWQIDGRDSFPLAYKLESGRSTNMTGDNIYGNNDVNVGWAYATYIGYGTTNNKTYSVYSMTFTTAETQIMFGIDINRPVSNGDNCSCSESSHSSIGHRDKTCWIALENGKTYRLNNYPYNNDVYHPVKSDDNYPLAPPLKEVHETDIEEGNELILYYDASLSAIVRDSGKWTQTLPYRAFSGGSANSAQPVYLVVGNEYYKQTTPLNTDAVQALEGNRASGSSYTGTFAGASDGTYLYKFTVDKTKFSATQEFYFTTSHPQSEGDPVIITVPGNPSRTAKIKLPVGEYSQINETTHTIPHNCFYGDSSDSYIYGDQPTEATDNSGRGGYWDTVQGPRDPEKRAMANKAFTYTTEADPSTTVPVEATTSYNNVVPSAAVNVKAGTLSMIDSVVDISSGTAPKSADVSETTLTGRKVLNVTLFDYYSDYELNGKNRDTYPLARGWKERGYYGFMSLNNAMSKEYKAKSEEVALYVGNFQRDSFGSGKWSGLAPYGNWLYDFNSDTGNASDKYRTFLSHNNSTVKYSGDVSTDYQAVSWNLVDKNTKADGTGHTKGAGLYTNNASMLLPYFDTNFLSGSNVLDAKLGKVYEDVVFPFSIERRQKKNTEADKNKYVDYYVFAARNDMMSHNSNDDYTTTRSNDQGYGDAAILKRSGNTYFIDSTVNTSISGHYNIENTGAEQAAKGSMGFFPFNEDLPNTSNSAKESLRYNYGYGMKFETTFKMRKDGMVLAKNKNGEEFTSQEIGDNLSDYLTPMKFRFSGDDDVWVFIDGQLVLDLGGDHTAAEGEIWFNTGETDSTKPGYNKISSSVGRVNGADGVVKASPGTETEKRNKYVDNENVNETVQYFTISDYDVTDHSGKYGIHTLTMYYMERGMWDSNMMIEFNLESYPADSPKVDLIINKNWSPATSEADEVSFIVLQEGEIINTSTGEKNTSRVTDSHGNNVFTIKKTDTDKFIKLEGKEAFIDGKESKGRFVYKVYEIDKGFDNTKAYNHADNIGHYHLVGSIGGGSGAGKDTLTVGNRSGALTNDSDSFTLKYNTTTDQVYKLTGTASCTSANAPYFDSNPDALNHDGEYTFTATNRATMDITAKKAFVGMDGHGLAAKASNNPVPIIALARSTNGSSTTPSDWTIVAVKNTAYASAYVTNGITYTWQDQPRVDGSSNPYYYKVVELSPTTTNVSGLVNSTLAAVTVLGSNAVKFGDGYYYKVTTAAQNGPTVAPAVGDMNLGIITNKVTPGKLLINKYASGTETRLEAIFTLYKSDGTTVAQNTSNANITLTTSTTQAVELNLADINFTGVSSWPVTYQLKETTPPRDCQLQPGYLEIKIYADGSFSAEAKEGFGIGNLSGTTGSGVSITGPTVVLDASSPEYPTINISVGNPTKVSVSASKTFSPALATGEGTTVYLKLMRNKYDSDTYVADGDFTGDVVTLNGTADTGTLPASYESAGWTATWTGLPRYDSSDKPYQYYVVEVQDSSGTAIGSSGNIDLTITGGSNPGHRTYSVTQSTPQTAPENTGDITGLTVTNESVDATVTKTWTNYTPVSGDVLYLKLQCTTAASFSDATSGQITDVSQITVTMGEPSPTKSHTNLSGSTVVLSTGTGTWTVLVKGLPKKTAGGDTILYRFVETNASWTPFTNGSINGAWTVAYSTTSPYSVIQSTSLPEAYQSGTTTFSTAVTNTLEKTDITLTKTWTGTTGSSITMMLEWTEDTWPSTPGSTANDLEFTVTASNLEGKTSAQPYQVQASRPQILAYLDNGSWVVVVKDMQKYSGGAVRRYRFIEMNGSSPVAQDGVVGGFKVSYGETSGYPTPTTATYSQTINNTPANVNITVNKVFKNAAGTVISSTITDTIYVKLRRTGGDSTEDAAFNNLSNTTTNPVVSITKNNNVFTHTWNDQPKTHGTDLYTYSVIEVEPASGGGYQELTGGKIKVSNVIYSVTNTAATQVTLANQDPMTFTVTNTVVQPLLDIIKQDSANENTKLAGAVFTLRRTHSDTEGNTAIDSAQVSENTWTSTATATTTGLTSTWTNGANATLTGLPDGRYELYESQAPNGYAMHSGKVIFTIENGLMTVGNHSASGLVGSDPYYTTEISSNVVHFKMTFENTAGTELPGTGTVFGLSRMGFASLGTVLLTAFVALYMYKKRQRYYEAEDDNI